MNRNLFVYGTLKLTATSLMGGEQRARLAGEGRSLGNATMQGRLFDLGRYPGVVDSDAPENLVLGEVIELADPAKSLPWLDAYEGIEPGPSGSEYTREERAVLLQIPNAAARRVTAWVYIYAWDVSRGRPVPHSLSDEVRKDVGLTRETWKLEVVSDPAHPATLGRQFTKRDDTALDFAGRFAVLSHLPLFMPDPAKAVFLSYASQDADAARRICESLRADGVEVWFDAAVGGADDDS